MGGVDDENAKYIPTEEEIKKECDLIFQAHLKKIEEIY